MKIAVFYNSDAGALSGSIDRVAVLSVADVAREVVGVLRSLGYDVVRLEVGRDLMQVVRFIQDEGPDIAFNLVESIQDEPRLEAAFRWMLEWLHVPATGSSGEALSLALDKGAAKALLLGHKLPVPVGAVLKMGDEDFSHVPCPWIVKPAQQDASHGIDRTSVSDDPRAIRRKALQLFERYRGPVLVEEFIDGRELNVAILGSGATAEVLPPGEIDFSGLDAGEPRILTYESKWSESSPACINTPAVPATNLGADMRAEIARLALNAYAALGLSGYGRVDFRLHPTRGPFILEVNPNPDLSRDAGLAKAAARASLGYEDLIHRIVGATS